MISPIFIVGGTRTGSTFLYQLMSKYSDLWYITNNVNKNYYKEPVEGIKHEVKKDIKKYITLNNSYGKTKNQFDVSEASMVLANWFGGDHPSQTKSCKILNTKKEQHMFNTFKHVKEKLGKDIVIKNAWNNFRVKEIKRIIPNSKFIWIKRDIRDAAISDYFARKRLGNTKNIWNSSTPANYKEIQNLEPFEQVILQQYEYYKALEETLCNHIVIWYEDLCVNTNQVIKKINDYANVNFKEINKEFKISRKRNENKSIFKKVDEKVKALNLERYNA